MFRKFTNPKKTKKTIITYLNPHPLCGLSSPYDDFKTSLLLTYLLLQVP